MADNKLKSLSSSDVFNRLFTHGEPQTATEAAIIEPEPTSADIPRETYYPEKKKRGPKPNLDNPKHSKHFYLTDDIIRALELRVFKDKSQKDASAHVQAALTEYLAEEIAEISRK